ncbi:MAG: PHB depolymerase family esterase [Bacteroidota bacterium]
MYDSIFVGGRWRTFNTHLPTGYNGNQLYPMVLGLHPLGNSSWTEFAAQTKLTPKSDSASFIMVYPEGVKSGMGRSWNAGTCCGGAQTQNIDDVGFINTLLDTLINRYKVDSTRIYATGFSNGALMTFRLADQLAQRFAAVAIVGGALIYSPWNPAKTVPIMSIHSYADQVIAYNGNTSPMLGTFPSQENVYNTVNAKYNCLNSKDTVFYNSSSYTHIIYTDCPCNASIERYVTQDGSHSWPGGAANGPFPISNKINATYIIWNFFKKYTNDCAVTKTEDAQKTNESVFSYFPNPVRDALTVLAKQQGKLLIYNQLGTKITEVPLLESETIVPCDHLASGVYTLQFLNKVGMPISVKKLIVLK